MAVSERPPRGEYYFSLGWIRYYRYRTIEKERERESAKQPPRRRSGYVAASAAVVRSRVENSREQRLYGSRDRSWYQYFKGARSSIDRSFSA